MSGLSKDALRKYGVAARNGIPAADRARFNRAISGGILRSNEFAAASVIMLYRAFGGEADVAALSVFALAAGKRIAYPYCADKSKLYALEPKDANAWVKGAFGILSPDPARSARIDPADINLVIVPCTAYDGRKNRLGMGGGYYDRFLPTCENATTVIAAYSTQYVETLPMEPHDVPADYIATELDFF